MKLLHIDSSPLAANSVSRQLTAPHRRRNGRPRHPGTDGRVPRPGRRRARRTWTLDSLGFRLGTERRRPDAERSGARTRSPSSW